MFKAFLLNPRILIQYMTMVLFTGRNDYSVLTGVKKLAQFMYEITARFVPKFEKSCLFVVFVYISVW